MFITCINKRLFGYVYFILVVRTRASMYNCTYSGNVCARDSVHVRPFSGKIREHASVDIDARAYTNTCARAYANIHPHGGFFVCLFVILSNFTSLLMSQLVKPVWPVKRLGSFIFAAAPYH